MATEREPRPPVQISDLVYRVLDDVKVIARDEVELARMELSATAKGAAADTAVVLFAGIVALIGLAFAGAALVAALGPVIPPLWLRLIIAGVVYVGVGTLVTHSFIRRLSRDVVPDLAAPVQQARETAQNIARGLSD